jgi:hypothetical protein
LSSHASLAVAGCKDWTAHCCISVSNVAASLRSDMVSISGPGGPAAGIAASIGHISPAKRRKSLRVKPRYVSSPPWPSRWRRPCWRSSHIAGVTTSPSFITAAAAGVTSVAVDAAAVGGIASLTLVLPPSAAMLPPDCGADRSLLAYRAHGAEQP